ncbi:MAG: putative poly(beta-D-mannuronate) O-acetylase [Gammaproteobacteria bacterium]|jgi:alginate O-acetyltransferase complex protein AlgI|nr:putative poly(beta-D-mannuronate) O-acetylase [Gammaproteobacteria bacterium]
MLFNSADYVLFLPLVLLVYVLLRRVGLRAQNAWLLIASYVFYGWWDWRFLGLLFGTTLNDYLVGLGLERTTQPSRRRALILLSIGVNLGVLGFFKYYNFFVASLIDAFAGIGVHLQAPTLKVILPVGISFYTFQALTYTIGVYRREMRATRDAIGFFAYVAFFPQLVAGPIERARHLLPQFFTPRVIEPESFASGLRQMLWGFFCKLVVADNCATVVNRIFNHGAGLPGSIVLLGSVLFAFQIYADFSGYSHIALGTARLFGFELMQNFATPYFSQSHPEFWRRWHISLSTWFRDYVYIPLGGNRASKPRQAFNLLVTFTLSGLWHGANWTFIVWGVLNGLYVIPRVFIGEPLARPASSPRFFVRAPTIALRILVTFALTVVAWIFFRSPTIGGAWTVLREIASPSLFSSPVAGLRSLYLLSTVAYAGVAIVFLLAMEWWQRDKRYALELGERAALLTWPACALVFVITLLFRYTGASLDFIYFQF